MVPMSALEVLLGLVMLASLVGIVVPFLPGIPLIWGAGLVWAITVPNDGPWAWVALALMTVFAVAGLVAATTLPARRANEVGAPGWVLAAGVGGMIVGFFLIPVVGALIGWPVGVFLAEAVRLRDVGAAWATTVSSLKGMGLGIGIQLAAGAAMIGVWIAALVMT